MCHDESTSAAPGTSPGIVQDREVLIREMFKPHHTDGNGKIHKRTIPIDELISSGFSVHRKAHVSRKLVEESIKTRESIPREEPWEFIGLAILKTSKIREILWEEHQALKVVDTATQENPAHASIYCNCKYQRPKSRVREIRDMLIPLLENIMPIDEAFSN